MFKKVLFDLSNFINGLVNHQVLRFMVKKNGHWQEASKMDLLFFKSEHMPQRRGDLLQASTWDNKMLAVFYANKNKKDIKYVVKQLGDAEKMAPAWLRESSMQPGLV